MTGRHGDDPVRSDVDAGGLRGHVFSSRRPPGSLKAGTPAVVLIHGIGVSHRYLARLHRRLSDSADTFSIDLPGFGATPRPDRQLTVSDYGAYILGALEQLGVDDAILVGHSMGAQFAIEAAIQRPDRIRRLVLMGPVVDSRHRSVVGQAVALGRDSLFFESPSSNFLVATDYFRCGPTWYLKTLRVMLAYRTEDRIADVKAPILVIRGMHDPVAGPDWCRRLAGEAAAGRLVEVPRSGHVVQHTAASEVADAIRSFAGLPTALPEFQG
jgi:pimeloyl-ACP methyl ester carboxylesterase